MAEKKRNSLEGKSTEKVAQENGSLKIKDMQMLDDICDNDENFVILFYSSNCPYCKALFPVFEKIAKKIHKTNNNNEVVPIILAEMDGITFKEAINIERPGFFNNDNPDPKQRRGYPTILFKRFNPTTMKSDAFIWDFNFPSNEQNLLKFISKFFSDNKLYPIPNDLANKMENTNTEPKYALFFYENYIVPRFTKDLIEYTFDSMVDSQELNDTISKVFLEHEELHKEGAAFPLHAMDRPDIRAPTIYDFADNKEYSYNDALKWLKSKIK